MVGPERLAIRQVFFLLVEETSSIFAINYYSMNSKEFKKLTDELVSSGYVCYSKGQFKNEDYYYAKSFLDESGNKKYQILILVYDFSKIESIPLNGFSIQYECLICGEGRVDMSVSKDDIDLLKFEEMSELFYQHLKKYNL